MKNQIIFECIYRDGIEFYSELQRGDLHQNRDSAVEEILTTDVHGGFIKNPHDRMIYKDYEFIHKDDLTFYGTNNESVAYIIEREIKNRKEEK